MTEEEQKKLNNELFLAVTGGNWLDPIIAKGADVNAKNGYGKTVLMYAVMYAGDDEIETLIAAGADVNAKDEDGKTVLMYAREARKAELLIEAGADVNAKDRYGRTVLTNVGLEQRVWRDSTEDDRKEYRELLIKFGAKVEYEALFEAFKHENSLEKLKWAIATGADVNVTDMECKTPLMHAKTAEETKLLLEAGASVKAVEVEMAKPRRRVRRSTGAARGEATDKIEVRKHSALMYAQTAEQTKLLLDAGAGEDINAKDEKGRTALMNVSSEEQAKLLIEAGADVNALDDRGKGALACYLEMYTQDFNDKVSFGGDEKVVKALLEAGVSMEGECSISGLYSCSVKEIISEINDPEIRDTVCNMVRDPECIRKHIEERKANIKKSRQLRKSLEKQNPTEKVSGVALADEIARNVISGKEKRTITPGVALDIKRKKAAEK